MNNYILVPGLDPGPPVKNSRNKSMPFFVSTDGRSQLFGREWRFIINFSSPAGRLVPPSSYFVWLWRAGAKIFHPPSFHYSGQAERFFNAPPSPDSERSEEFPACSADRRGLPFRSKNPQYGSRFFMSGLKRLLDLDQSWICHESNFRTWFGFGCPLIFLYLI